MRVNIHRAQERGMQAEGKDLEVDLLPGVNSTRLVGVGGAEVDHGLSEVVWNLRCMRETA